MDNAPNEDGSDPHGRLPNDLNEACDHFELAWQQGQHPRIEDYLEAVPEAARPELLGELLAIELHWRRLRRQQPSVADYRERFPRFDNEVEGAFAGPPSDSSSDSRTQAAISPVVLHLRCPHCRNRIELVNLDPQLEVECPSCSNRFHVVGDGLSGASKLPDAAAAGSKSIGRFELMDPLGTGAFGSVWKARDTHLDRFVAVKIPRKEHLAAEEIEQFLREARAAAQLQHAGIVSIHEIGVDGDLIYIVSDLVDGAPLDKWLDENTPSRREVVEICAKIAEALHYAHEQGVVHRDLKPGNIMIDDTGAPHLMDFGLAKREAGEITMTLQGQVLGTPAYMSPEQAKGEGHDADCRSDVYSLGVVLYEMLTGERPFRGNMRMLLKQVIDDDAPTPRKLNSKIPRDLETICLKCLEKSPDRRYPTAASMGEELQRHLRGEPIQARPISSTGRAWRWCRRNPNVAALVSAVAISLVAGTIVSTYFAVQASLRAYDERIARWNADANAALAREQEQRADAKAAEATRHMQEAQLAVYTLQIRSAHRDLVERDIGHAESILRSCQSDLVGWEHRFLETCCSRQMQTLQHNAAVIDVAFSRDGQRIISAGSDHAVRVWDTDTGRQLLTLTGHRDDVAAVAVNHDDSQIASASFDKTLKLWNANEGIEIKTFEGHTERVTDVAFSPGGARIVSSSLDKTLRLWDIATGKSMLTLSGHTDVVWAVTFDPTSPRVLSGSDDNTLRLWDADTGELIRKFEGHQGPVRSVAFSSDGTRVASTGWDKLVKIWDASTGEEIRSFAGHTEWSVDGVAFSPDGTRVISCGWDQTLREWDIATGSEVYCFTGHTDAVTDVAVGPHGDRIVTGSIDGTVRIWRPETTFKHMKLQNQSGSLMSIAVSPDSAKIASASFDNNVHIESPDASHVLRGHSAWVAHVAFSSDGLRVVSGGLDATIRVWDVISGEQELVLRGHRGAVTWVEFSPDGSQIASACFKGISVDDSDDSAPIKSEGTVKIWDVAEGKELVTFRGHAGAVNSLAFSPDGQQIISASSDKTLKIWDPLTGEVKRTFRGHTDPVYHVAFSSDGKRVVSGGVDATVRVWNAQTGRLELVLEGHSESISRTVFSPDGSRIISASERGTIRVWHAFKGNELLALPLKAESIQHLSFSPDGSRIIVGVRQAAIMSFEAKPLNHPSETRP